MKKKLSALVKGTGMFKSAQDLTKEGAGGMVGRFDKSGVCGRGESRLFQGYNLTNWSPPSQAGTIRKVSKLVSERRRKGTSNATRRRRGQRWERAGEVCDKTYVRKHSKATEACWRAVERGRALLGPVF